MKVLWIVNVVLPQIAKVFGESSNGSGGWLSGAYEGLNTIGNIELSICFPGNRKNITSAMQDNCCFFSFSSTSDLKRKKANLSYELTEILSAVEPDIVHIWGTEFYHSYIMQCLCNEKGIPTVLSIQGLISILSLHYTSGLPWKVIHAFTLRDILKFENIAIAQKRMRKRSAAEIETLLITKNVIGRTDWDRACTLLANRQIKYHHCNEILRSTFYDGSVWSMKQCRPYSVFVSQGFYPIKGLHQMLNAMRIILHFFPNAILYIGGADCTKSILRMSSYGRYVHQLIKNGNMTSSVVFTGPMTADDMKRHYLSTNVFVCPSVIENSPNSLGEAMILGVPCVCSDVGGIRSMALDKNEVLIYPFDEPYMLAFYIMQIFDNVKLAETLSKNARIRATTTHDRAKNTKDLVNIYQSVFHRRTD